MFDLICNIGGVMGIIITVLSIFISPISEHSFMVKALEKLYLARTEQSDLFAKPSKVEHVKDLYKETKIEEEVKKHFPIKLSLGKNLKLFCINICCGNSCWKKWWKTSFNLSDKRLRTMYDKGVSRIEFDLSIEQLIRNTRNSKAYIKN